MSNSYNGYRFPEVQDEKSVRQFINLDEVWNIPNGNKGKLAVIHVAQDQTPVEKVQADSRLQYNIYNDDLAEATDNFRGVDATMALSEKQWGKMLDNGSIVEDKATLSYNRETGQEEMRSIQYLAYESDIFISSTGPQIVTDTIKSLDTPLDIDKHGEITVDKINENSPDAQARMAVRRRFEREVSQELNVDDIFDVGSTESETMSIVEEISNRVKEFLDTKGSFNDDVGDSGDGDGSSGSSTQGSTEFDEFDTQTLDISDLGRVGEGEVHRGLGEYETKHKQRDLKDARDKLREVRENAKEEAKDNDKDFDGISM